jgi:hypothetical protein
LRWFLLGATGSRADLPEERCGQMHGERGHTYRFL